MPKRHLSIALVLGAAVGAAACSGGGTPPVNAGPVVEERTFALKVAPPRFRVDVLGAELADLSVVERVTKGSGEVVEPPKLRGTLKVKNATADQTVRLVRGSIQFLGKDGQPIALAPGRGGGELSFYGYSGDRLDPGKDTTQSIDVPFPAAAFDATAVSDVRLSLTYVPAPYRTEAATVSATMVADTR